MAMPGVTGPSDGVLRGGQFFSHVARQERHEQLVLSELWEPAVGRAPHHEHELAYVTVVLDGHYAEGSRCGWSELPPFSAIYNPSGVAHASRFGASGARLFTIECQPHLLEQLGVCLPDHPVVDPGCGAMLFSGMAMFSAFKAGTTDALLLDSHLAEMLGSLAPPGSAETSVPPWLGRVKERLHGQLRERVRIRDLARDAGVHPVHLARVFRMRERQTPGDYLQRLRVRAACALLRGEGASLAWIAAECGFADQSHLTRTFRKLVGSTPARFRNGFHAAPSRGGPSPS